MQFDAVIIGGGASGLMCAVAAKLKNSKLNIAIIEKNDRVGKKLLSTGNGRCNLTNKNVAADKYKGTFDGLADVLKRYDTDKLLSYFKNLGLLTFCDSEGRYYPVSKQASSVLDVLRFNAERLGVTILCKQNIHSISRQNGFTVKTADGVITADKLVICCGSKASPKLGGSASASDYLKNLGHTVLPFSPALCQVKVDASAETARKLKPKAARFSLRTAHCRVFVCSTYPFTPKKAIKSASIYLIIFLIKNYIRIYLIIKSCLQTSQPKISSRVFFKKGLLRL